MIQAALKCRQGLLAQGTPSMDLRHCSQEGFPHLLMLPQAGDLL